MIRFQNLVMLLWLLVPLALGLWAWRGGLWARRAVPERVALALRIAALTILALALSGPQLLSRVETHRIYFVVDLSESTRAARVADDWLAELRAWAVPRPHVEYGLIVFGREAFVEAPLGPTLDVDRVYTPVDGEGTDLAAALELALGAFPEGGAKTIVLLTDGRATEGVPELEAALARAAREGVPVFTVPLEAPAGTGEFAVQDLRVPEEVAVDLPFEYRALVYASRPTTARWLVYRNDELIENTEVALQRGLNFLEGRDELREPGVYEYRVELVIPEGGDTLPQNNAFRALVEAVGEPQIALVYDPETPSPTPLESLLRQAGYAYTRVPLGELAPTPASLLNYRAVVLDDVPLRALTRRQIEHLERYVRDLGGGLWVIQGRRAVEEFDDPEFERILPVTYEGPEEIQRPAIALVMLLDRSGSMGELAGAYRKIDLLKQAAMEAIERFEGKNLLGVIAFDSRYRWIVPLDRVEGRRSQILQEIGKLVPGGGTDIYEGLRDAIEALREVKARVKHILVFSDGKVARDRRDFRRIFREIAGSTISASSVAIGAQADFDFLWELAEAGRGAKYPVRDARDLPKITLEEFIRLERTRWIKGPVPTEPGPFAYELREIDPRAVPPVGGYVLTFEKPTAKTALVVRAGDDKTDPLVSSWRYGLGKVLVLNTSLSEGADAGRWLEWADLSALVGELLGKVYSEQPLQPKELVVRTKHEGSRLSVVVEAERDGRWLDGLQPQGRLSTPEGEVVSLPFEQTAPGRYEATLDDVPEGVYLLRVGEETLGEVQEAFSVPYPEEYRRVGVNPDLLSRIAYTTGGQYLDTLEGLSEQLAREARVYRDLWQPLAVLALLLFVGDLIARKLPLPVRSHRS